jgi:sugar phosphate isomerase/epimerase
MDPCNYFGPQDLTRVQPLLEEMFHKLGGQIVIAHAKDVKASPKGTDTPAAGTGVLDYPFFLRLLAQLNRPIDLVIEHVALADVPRARDYVRAQMEKI